MDNQIEIDNNVENQIKKRVMDFYEAYYRSDRLKLYGYLDLCFQQSVPLNYFLIHSDFDIDLGRLLEIHKIRVESEKKLAFIECEVEFQRGKKEVVIVLEFDSDSGDWKIDANSIFKRKL